MYIIKYIFWNFSKIQELFSDSADGSEHNDIFFRNRSLSVQISIILERLSKHEYFPAAPALWGGKKILRASW